MAKIKVGSQIGNFTCRWHATYRWKDLDEGYNFALDLTSIRGFHTSYGPPKLWESQFWVFQDSNLGVPRQNDIWVLVPWLGTKYTIKGKVMASPKFGPW